MIDWGHKAGGADDCPETGRSSDDCPYCTGELCAQCGDEECDHGTDERHESALERQEAQ